MHLVVWLDVNPWEMLLLSTPCLERLEIDFMHGGSFSVHLMQLMLMVLQTPDPPDIIYNPLLCSLPLRFKDMGLHVPSPLLLRQRSFPEFTPQSDNPRWHSTRTEHSARKLLFFLKEHLYRLKLEPGCRTDTGPWRISLSVFVDLPPHGPQNSPMFPTI